jgi:cytosine/adenosine deaminase-related metal-dependent hydrolase
MSIRQIVCRAVVAIVLPSLPACAQVKNLGLRGTIVTPDEVIENGIVLISGTKIQEVGQNAAVPRDVKVVETGIIYPGLIDLHNHLTWNFLPRWKPNRLFATRYEWESLPEYRINLSTPHSRILAEGLGCDSNQYAEVKSIIGGATSVVGSLNPSQVPLAEGKCIEGLARNLDFYSGLYPPSAAEKLRYEVFPLELSEVDVAQITKALDKHDLTALIVHLSEGKSSDANAERELRILSARGLLRSGVSVIHGAALNPLDFRELAQKGVGLIWSPRSNFELYGDTTDVRSAKQAQLKMALAPDWSATGSDGMLQELKFAATWNEGQYPKVFTDVELTQMATTNPAQLAGLSDKIGAIKAGYFADLLVLRQTGRDPYQSLLLAAPADVRLVLIGGQPVYGDEDLMRKLVPASELEALSVCGVTKALDLASEAATQGSPPRSWKETLSALNHALNEWGLGPVQPTACPN